MYSIKNGLEYDLPDSVAYIMSLNGFVEIIDENWVENFEPTKLWGQAKTYNRRLKRYGGDKYNLCVNARDDAQVAQIAFKYGELFDEFTCPVGKYRFYGGEWNSQIQKRSSYLKEDRINVILDTDEKMSGNFHLPSGYDVGWAKVTNNGKKERMQPRVFRGIEGMHYLKRHHWMFDGNGDLISSHSIKGPKYKHVELELCIDNTQDSKYKTDKELKERQEYRRHIFNAEFIHSETDNANLYICHINNEDMAGLSGRLSRAINKYTRHSSRAYKSVENYLGFDGTFSTDDESYKKSVRSADIIVFNETYPIEIPNKPIIMIHHGSWYRNHLEGLKKMDDVANIILGTTTDLLQHDKRMLWLPSIVDDEYLASFKGEPEYEVLHTTTSRVKKNTDEIAKYLPDIKIIEGVSYEEAMREKGKAKIVVDQISDIGIGLGAIEAMAMGIPVISGAGEYAVKKYKEIVGYIPFTNVKSASELPEAVEYVNKNYKKLSKQALEYVKKYHSAEVCAKRFEKICFMALRSQKVTQEDLCV